MTYQAPLADMGFALKYGTGLLPALEDGFFGDLTIDDVEAVLSEAGRMAGEVIAPLNRVGDETGTTFKDGVVTTAPGWKEAYHAWGMFASPLLTALLAASEHVARAAGVRGKAARKRMLPILRQTLANYAKLGAPGSFSGPIARGDVATVGKHLKVLLEVPEVRGVYVALARSALRGLPAKNRAALGEILKR